MQDAAPHSPPLESAPTPSPSPSSTPARIGRRSRAEAMPQAGDEILVLEAQGGDRAAMGELLRMQQDRVFNTCLRVLGDRDDAADAAQEAMLKAVRSIDGFQGASRFGTWITRIAVNESLTLLRKRARRPAASLDAGAGGAGDGGGDVGSVAVDRWLADDREPGPARRVEEAERVRLTLEALDGLDPDSRAVLVLRDIEGQAYADIAAALDLPAGTVKSRLFRARLALRQQVEARDARGPAPPDATPTPDPTKP